MSSLFYAGTGQEVRLGDRVRVRRFLRKPREGAVYYIPGISTKHPELEYEDVRQWAIKADDGAVYPILYDPVRFQPPKTIELISRGPAPDFNPEDLDDGYSEPADEEDDEE